MEFHKTVYRSGIHSICLVCKQGGPEKWQEVVFLSRSVHNQMTLASRIQI
jgi:hypothetical protein